MKRYIKPEFEVMLIKAEDIIQTSGELIEAVNGVKTQDVQSAGTVTVVKSEAVDTNGNITMNIFD